VDLNIGKYSDGASEKSGGRAKELELIQYGGRVMGVDSKAGEAQYLYLSVL
jgi:hypothetical protein